jgi:hypothetical protein
MGRLRLASSAAIYAVVTVALSTACGSSQDAKGFTPGGDAPRPDLTGSDGSGDGLDGGVPSAPACASVVEEATSKPLNLYVMYDKSNSQVGTKWNAAREGLAAFLVDPSSAGVRVALNFFPRAPDQRPVCDQTAYKEPRVPFGVLPAHASAIVSAIQNETPDGFSTPIYPALGGAILGALEEVRARPGEAAAVLLVTDGEPTGPAERCGGVNPEDVGEIRNVARAGVQQAPGVRTYVIGLPGVVPTIANQIADAGGTKKAFIVAGTNLQADFQRALSEVRGNALPCEYELPARVADKTYAFDRVNVRVAPGGGQPETVAQDATCAGEGWRYDDARSPTKIVLCAATCDRLKGDFGAKLDIALGCTTVVK